jgi:hypothetical protein
MAAVRHIGINQTGVWVFIVYENKYPNMSIFDLVCL